MTNWKPRDIAASVAEFHAMIASPPWDGPIGDMPAESIELRNKLIDSEVTELIGATVAGDLVGIADGLADVVYVAYGTAYTYGIDLDAVLAEVHRSNMTKEPGPTGKAVKGARYSPPDIAELLGAGGFERCPGCDSPNPRLHPATQYEGEVAFICPNPWHTQLAPAESRESGTDAPTREQSAAVLEAAMEWRRVHATFDARATSEAAVVLLKAVDALDQMPLFGLSGDVHREGGKP
jgi:hypothetical protein